MKINDTDPAPNMRSLVMLPGCLWVRAGDRFRGE